MSEPQDLRTDRLEPALLARFLATFDRPARDTGPQGIHWCLCTPDAATAALGPDGHPAGGGGFLPVSPLPRRMWASSTVTFQRPIPLGAAIERTSIVASTTEKAGASGKLLFVEVDHRTTTDGAIAVEERQTLVYREAPAPGAPAPTPPAPAADEHWDWRRELVPTPPLLFRYSALTFNTHRIHYDLPYATQAEGYPALVVHGPLMASLLLDLADRELGPDRLATFAFRAVAPAFVDAPLTLLGRVEGKQVTLKVRGADGRDHVAATATI
jgi:3-methylfumaryl-CoA hydratase